MKTAVCLVPMTIITFILFPIPNTPYKCFFCVFMTPAAVATKDVPTYSPYLFPELAVL